jgi:hypothetical protein
MLLRCLFTAHIMRSSIRMQIVLATKEVFDTRFILEVHDTLLHST